MVIACYAGVGKSTFAKQYPEDALDLVSMPFSWILPEKSEGEFEDVKAARYLLRNPAFTESYLAAILEAEQTYQYVLIPTISPILRTLHERYQVSYIICYPQIGLKEEYRKRYAVRGNTDDFLDIFIEQWDDRIDYLMQDATGRHIVLGSGMFLTDVKEEIDSLIGEMADVNPKDAVQRKVEIAELKESAEETLRYGCLCITDMKYYYFLMDLCKPNNRRWLYELGRNYYEKDIRISVYDARWMLPFYEQAFGLDNPEDSKQPFDPDEVQELRSRQEVIDFLESISDYSSF